MLRHTLAASALFLAAASPALADTVRTEVVTYGDLNLKHPAGADRLIDRIEGAAENVCGANGGTTPLTERQEVRQCSNVAEQDAVYDVGHPMVSARYYGHTPEIVIDPDYTGKY